MGAFHPYVDRAGPRHGFPPLSREAIGLEFLSTTADHLDFLRGPVLRPMARGWAANHLCPEDGLRKAQLLEKTSSGPLQGASDLC